MITIGSMSKTFWAGLRIGWVRANPALIQRLAAARAALDISSPVLEQLMAVELLDGAEPILARQREAARARRDVLRRRAARAAPGWRFAVPPGGLCLWVELDAPRSTALAAIADRHGVRLAAGPRFGVDGAFERYVAAARTASRRRCSRTPRPGWPSRGAASPSPAPVRRTGAGPRRVGGHGAPTRDVAAAWSTR